MTKPYSAVPPDEASIKIAQLKFQSFELRNFVVLMKTFKE
jgi:hypothetical protein